MKTDTIRKIFLDFFKEKEHEIVPSASLIPADTSALFTSAGMQQFVPYLSGEVEPPYRRACSAQKCFRTSDIDEIGDEFHHTYFEMLGNWSFGDYFKRRAIEWALELLIDGYHLDKNKLWTTIFSGEEGVPKDTEAAKLWEKAGIDKKRIKAFGMADNFWGPVGSCGPCGPCTEIHYDRGNKFQKATCTISECGPNCGCGRFVEIWNLVFMEYSKSLSSPSVYIYKKLSTHNVDTGAGLERLAAVLQNTASNYETDLFLPILHKIKELPASLSSSQTTLSSSDTVRASRIIADHMRAVCFLIADGVIPSNEDRGYMLRRLMRRAIRYARLLQMSKNFLIPICQVIIDVYKGQYPELEKKQSDILMFVQNEEEKFMKSLHDGMKRFRKLARETQEQRKYVLDSKKIFQLYDTYGFPLELTAEMAQEQGLKIDKKGFEKEFERHRNVSRAGAYHKFSGVGEWGDKVAPQHSATHLLHKALRQVLGEHVHQDGSDLTPERLRFDFIHPKPLTKEEIKKIEDLVNEQIHKNLPVSVKKMKFEDAIKSGALAFFREKYPKEVTVYTMGDFSKEVCTGPHVEHTNQIGKFKIVKDEALSAGVRRIRAVVEDSTYEPKGISVFDSKNI